MKKCSRCGDKKSLDEFYKDKYNKDKLKCYCKNCDNYINKKIRLKYPLRSLLWNIKSRAKRKGIPFDLNEDEIEFPEVCPVFKKPFAFGLGKLNDLSPSLDRIDNSKGYIKGNIIIVSWKANRIKNDATIEELRILTNFYESL